MPAAPRWHVFPDAEALAAAAASLILEAGAAAIREHGVFQLVLAGGRTPLAVYERLARAAGEWPRWQVWFGDERCLPPGDPGRNDSAVRNVWLDRAPLPSENIHAIPAELGPEEAVKRYSAKLAGIGEFDLVLLGLGADGHIASLFPGHPLGASVGDPDVLAVRAAPKPPPERVSLSVARLARARRVLFLVTGADKRQAVAAWKGGADLPAARITPAAGVDVWFDRAADGEKRV